MPWPLLSRHITLLTVHYINGVCLSHVQSQLKVVLSHPNNLIESPALEASHLIGAIFAPDHHEFLHL